MNRLNIYKKIKMIVNDRFKIEEKILNWDKWIHVVLALFTYFIWLIILLVIYIDLKNNKNIIANNDIQSVKKYYENEFIIDGCEDYIDNIEKIIKIEKANGSIDLYDGMNSKDIKECGYDVGEIDEQETPDVKLNYYEGSTKKYIGVSIYHSEFDKYLKVGNIPASEFDKIKPYLDKKILIWGSFKGGTFKTVNNDNKIEKYKKPIEIKLTIKIFER